jgi:alanyl-tRNA synthetase
VSLTNESSVGSGSRRIEALVGIEAFRALTQERILLHQIAEQLKTSPAGTAEKLEQMLTELKDAQRKLAAVQGSALATLVPDIIASAKTVGNSRLISKVISDVSSAEALRDLVIKVRDQVATEPAIVALFAVIEDKPVVIVAATTSAQAAGLKSGDLVRTASAVLGGGGGGKPDLAQGGGTDSSKFDAALIAIAESID